MGWELHRGQVSSLPRDMIGCVMAALGDGCEVINYRTCLRASVSGPGVGRS